MKVATKAGVRLPRSPEMQQALAIAAQLGHVITSGNDGQHLPNSTHYTDQAIDIRQAGDLQEQAKPYRAAGYHVLIEGPNFPGSTGAHLHVSKDPEGKRV